MKVFLLAYLLFSPFFLFSQKQPENWGGKQEKDRIFNQEVYYSQAALDNFYGGKVELEFSLTEEGVADNINVIKSVSKDINLEAKRLLQLLLFETNPEEKESQFIKRRISFKFSPYKYKSICDARGYQISSPDPGFLFRIYQEEEVSEKPMFEGKEGSFESYVKKNLVYPYEAVKTGAQGIVTLKFVIEPSGRITNLAIVEGLEANCDIAAKNLILNSKWKAGSQHGIKVRTLMYRKFYFSPKGKNQFISIPDKP